MVPEDSGVRYPLAQPLLVFVIQRIMYGSYFAAVKALLYGLLTGIIAVGEYMVGEPEESALNPFFCEPLASIPAMSPKIYPLFAIKQPPLNQIPPGRQTHRFPQHKIAVIPLVAHEMSDARLPAYRTDEKLVVYKCRVFERVFRHPFDIGCISAEIPVAVPFLVNQAKYRFAI